MLVLCCLILSLYLIYVYLTSLTRKSVMSSSPIDEFMREAQAKYEQRGGILNTIKRQNKKNYPLESNANVNRVAHSQTDGSDTDSAKLQEEGEGVVTSESFSFQAAEVDENGSFNDSISMVNTFGRKISDSDSASVQEKSSLTRRTYGEAFGADEEEEKIIFTERQETTVIRRVSRTSSKSSRHESPNRSVLSRVSEMEAAYMSPKVKDIPFKKVSNIRAKFETGETPQSLKPNVINFGTPKTLEKSSSRKTSVAESVNSEIAQNIPHIDQEPIQELDLDAIDQLEEEPTETPATPPPVPPHSHVDEAEGPKTIENDPKPTENEENFDEPECQPLPSPIVTPARGEKPLKFFGSNDIQHSTPEVFLETPKNNRRDVDTPSRSGLIDEINADFEEFQRNSLPRTRKASKDVDCNDGTPYRSMTEYRKELSEKIHQRHFESGTEESPKPVSNEASEEEKKEYVNLVLKKLTHDMKVAKAQYNQAKRALQLISSKSQKDEEETVTAHHVMLQCRAGVEAAMRMHEIIEYNPSAALLPEMKASFSFNRVTFDIHPEFQRDILVKPISCYFAIIITHRETVKWSSCISARKHNKGKISVEMYTNIDGVGPGFEIFVEVYMLTLAKPDEEKKSLVAEFMGTLLRGHAHRNDLKEMDCAFTRIGTTKIDSTNMRSRHLKTETVPPLGPRIDLSYDFKLMEASHRCEGFTRRYEIIAGVGNWANEYAAFGNWHIDFWPTERDHDEKKAPVSRINLKGAFSVEEIDSLACYNNAFVIKYKNMEDGNVESLTLATVTEEEQHVWLKTLNSYIKGLNFWAHHT
ncbi:unnamed protein product [Bursaphelenchus xylophilus]|uniref:(pine wood nematode) hypothetical protein n=1 Tax=Bursaphelenchus xylophilus TaxID=6326 RepID=A0A1I7SAW3_BURXY|nr:unnamed protein product [Bursaphelenchus xylophilus]CAG9106159.1 unnamed protein product [Bursaphelenchus xylophilus]